MRSSVFLSKCRIATSKESISRLSELNVWHSARFTGERLKPDIYFGLHSTAVIMDGLTVPHESLCLLCTV